MFNFFVISSIYDAPGISSTVRFATSDEFYLTTVRPTLPIQIQPPTEIHLPKTTPTSIQVSWTPSQDTVDNYRLNFNLFNYFYHLLNIFTKYLE